MNLIVTSVKMHFLIACMVSLKKLGLQAAPIGNGIDEREGAELTAQSTNKIFSLPTGLKIGDQIIVSGKIERYPERFSVNLVIKNKDSHSPDFNNVACQIKADYSTTLLINSVVNGEEQQHNKNDDFKPSDFFAEGAHFFIEFAIKTENNIDLNLQGSDFSCDLVHNIDDIGYLVLDGDIEKVNNINFVFA